MIKLNDYQKTIEIPQAIRVYLEEKQASQAQLCKSSGVGEAYVSMILQGKTHIGKTAIKDKYYLNLCSFIGYSLTLEIWRHFNTQNFKTIINQLKKVRETKGRLALDGDTGAGKSYACKKYQQKYPTGTYLITCLALENSKEFAINIAEVVGVETYGTAGRIIKRVVKKLLKEDNPILIIDESEHIDKKSGYINIIKSLADLLEGKVPIVLIGMDISNILQKKWYDRNKQVFKQTARRFSKRVKCSETITRDVEMICEELGVTNKPAQKWLMNRIKNFGELMELLVAAIEEAAKIKEPVTIKLLNSIYDGF
jgi:DNA transposition AAA+ family ATPase